LNIAIIPARKNSRRIKNKNIINFCGKPIIYYSLKAAKKSKLFDKIIVTTDCKKIKKLSYYYGADLVINRKEKLAKNNIGIINVIKDSIKILANDNINPDYVCCIFPASPNINIHNLKKSFLKIKKNKNGFVFAAGETFQKFTDSFFFDKKTLIKVKELNVLKKYLSKKLYIDAGQFYWAKKLTWLNSKTTFQKNSSIELIKNRKYVDINTHDDLKYAEYLFESK
jgi:pseudaminic acid cytidylyltransferase